MKMGFRGLRFETELRDGNRIGLGRGYGPYLERLRECFQSMQIWPQANVRDNRCAN